jgi:membrane protease YdiL (CAAX protease family)
MTETDATAEHPTFQGKPGTRWTALAAWAVILVVVVFVFARQRRLMVHAERTSHDNSFQRNLIELQGRQFVGTKEIAGGGEKLFKQAKGLDRGSFRQRLRFAVLAGELVGPKKALKLLDRLQPPDSQSNPAAAEDRKLYGDLHCLYWAYERQLYEPDAVLPEAERERLHRELGWFGDLALAPAQGPDKAARRAVVAPAAKMVREFTGAVFIALGLAAVGFVGLVALVILLSVRPWLRGFVPGSPYGAVYAETFALWMVLFSGLSLLNSRLPPTQSPLLRNTLLSLLSLAALAWPVWRGVPWRQVRQDVGLSFGRGAGVEAASGLATYVMALPLLFSALIATVVVSYFVKRAGGQGLFENSAPAHPLIGMAANDWWVRVQVVLAASVAAPLIEETMFRGVFYRHLREATNGAGFLLSLLASGLVSGFIFAVIHPQGALAVPLLMGLALGFAIGREWRGSLLPCMVAHGVHNGILVLFFLTALSG